MVVWWFCIIPSFSIVDAWDLRISDISSVAFTAVSQLETKSRWDCCRSPPPLPLPQVQRSVSSSPQKSLVWVRRMLKDVKVMLVGVSRPPPSFSNRKPEEKWPWEVNSRILLFYRTSTPDTPEESVVVGKCLGPFRAGRGRSLGCWEESRRSRWESRCIHPNLLVTIARETTWSRVLFKIYLQ